MKTKYILISALLSLAALMDAATPAHATATILHNFTNGVGDGSTPAGSLTLSGAKLYGMTGGGGSGSAGTVFSMNTDGTGFGVLHSFTDGGDPRDSLTLSGAKLYGMTNSGGSDGVGSIFSLNTDGTGYGLLHSFTSDANDGGYPRGSLTLAGSTLYGMTVQTGNSIGGTLFRINTDGTGFGLLHTFTGGASDGAAPAGSLTLSGSKFYGMTILGGGSNTGTLFTMDTDGTGFSLLHTFTGGASDGSQPFGSLTLFGSKLYGMTRNGGSTDNGTLFSVNTDGTGFGLLHTFIGGASDGSTPLGSLTLYGSKLYGMTEIGGSSGRGTLFSINADGTGFSLLDSFGGAPDDGALPLLGDLTLSDDGSMLYGMTLNGGTADQGVVFSETLAPEPGSFILLTFGTFLLSSHRRRCVT